MVLIIPVVPPIDPVTIGIDIVAVLGTIFGGLFGGIFGGGVPANIARALSGLRDSIVSLGNAMLKFAWRIAQGLAAAFELIKWLWSDVIRKLIQAIYGLAQKIYRILNRILKPIMDAIKRQRQQILDIYNRFVRPIIVLIEKLRRIIHILQIFHVHVFDALDRKLARLEIAVMTPILRALYRINTLGNWIAFILNGRLLIFRGLFLGTLGASQNSVFDMLSNVPNYNFAELTHAGPDTPSPVPALSFAQSSGAVKQTAGLEAIDVTDVAINDFVACLEAPMGNIEIDKAAADCWNCLTTI